MTSLRFAKVPCALKIVRFPTAMAASSRSSLKMTNLGADPNGNASRNCCTIPGQSNGTATFNLASATVTFAWATYTEQQGRGVEIEATVKGCDSCVWAQTVSGPDIKGGTKAVRARSRSAKISVYRRRHSSQRLVWPAREVVRTSQPQFYKYDKRNRGQYLRCKWLTHLGFTDFSSHGRFIRDSNTK
jgi:hypothetical protein